MILDWIIAVLIAAAIGFTLFHDWNRTNGKTRLSRAFFAFGVLCGVFAVSTQYGLVNQIGTQSLFGDPIFYLLLGMLGMMGGIYVNTDHSM